MRSLKVLAALLLSIAVPAWSQQLPLPEAAVNDPAALARAIPDLARQALGQLPADPLLKLEYQFRFQLASGQYEQALATFDEWNKLRPPPPASQTFEPFLRQEVHARAKVLEARERVPYGEALKRVVEQKFAPYDDRTAVDSAWNLELPPAAARANLDRQLRQLKGKRSITPAELVDVLRWHAVSQAVDSFAPALEAAIALDDAKRFIIDRSVLIKTPDGATLSAQVVRSRRSTGREPTVLHFTIYAEPATHLHDAKEAVVRGYTGVFAYARGKYLSTDQITPWETDARDTTAVIDWISKQAWSDGRVAMYGLSYNAFTQWAALKNPHPALKTIVPSGSSIPGYGVPMQNNVVQVAQYAWPFWVMNNRFLDNDTYNDNNRWFSLFQKWFESGRPWRELDAMDGTPNPLMHKQIQHPSFDAYWQAMQPYKEDYAKINIPILTITGYYDPANSAAVRYLVDHYKYNPRAEHYLVVGPYSHPGGIRAVKDPVIGGYAIDPVAQFDGTMLIYQWFDHVLKGGARPALITDRINYQVMGANTWRHASSIERMANRNLRLYLSDRKVGRRYDLSSRKPRATGFVEQVVDFADRKTQHNVYPGGAYLETPDSPTRIVYVSEPFEEVVSVDGLIRGELKATIDKKDFDFTFALYEAMPDGKYFNLSYYLARASYASDETKRKLLTPGRPASLPFSYTPIVSRQLAKGSRLVLLLTVNKNAYAQVNYGTGKDVSDESIADAKQPLHVKWHNGSFIDIPLRVGGADGAADAKQLTSSRASGT